MNKFVAALKSLDESSVEDLIKQPKWAAWSEPSGKNALHYVCGVPVTSDDAAEKSLKILKLLLKTGLDINSIHRIEGKNCDFFPATPLWYAYTRGRNEKLYKYLLKHGASPDHCWWAIAWYDDVAAAKLWLKHGATLGTKPTPDDLFLGSFQWNKMKFASWLVEQGADVNARGPGRMTVLMLAVKRKDEPAIKWLIANGADPDIKDEKGTSARKIAETKGPRRLLNLF
jgi:ankyrin repeat protein